MECSQRRSHERSRSNLDIRTKLLSYGKGAADAVTGPPPRMGPDSSFYIYRGGAIRQEYDLDQSEILNVTGPRGVSRPYGSIGENRR